MKKKILLTLMMICVSIFSFCTAVGAKIVGHSTSFVGTMQSEHPYENNTDCEWSYEKFRKNTDVTNLKIYFFKETETESGQDFIFIYNAASSDLTDENLIGTYSGTELSGKCILINGNTVTIKLVSNDSNNAYGFQVEKIEAFNNEELIAVGGYYNSDSSWLNTWSLTAEGTFEYDGDTEDYTAGTAPWYEYRDKIRTVDMGSNASKIGNYAFYNCNNLSSIKFDSVCNIGKYAFYGCDALNNVYYNGENAKWREMTVGDNNMPLIYADKHCMYDFSVRTPSEGVVPISTIESGKKININDIPTPEGCKVELYDEFNLFDIDTPITSNLCLDMVYRPLNEQYVYKIVNNEAVITDWDLFVEEIIVPDTIEGYPVTKIARTDLNPGWSVKAQTITLPDSVSEIGEEAFYGLYYLKSINLSNGITKIGRYAFCGCNNLTEIVIPNKVKTIDMYAFAYCYKLTDITLHSNIKFVAESAFSACSNLKTIKYIGTEADWDSITMGADNNCLTDAQLIYMSGTKTTVSEDGKSFTVKPINIASGKTVFLALYDGDTFVEAQAATYTGKTIPFITEKTYTTAKVMAWSSLENMTPLCGVEIVSN